jgi:hypothetical protein
MLGIPCRALAISLGCMGVDVPNESVGAGERA